MEEGGRDVSNQTFMDNIYGAAGASQPPSFSDDRKWFLGGWKYPPPLSFIWMYQRYQGYQRYVLQEYNIQCERVRQLIFSFSFSHSSVRASKDSNS